MGDSVLIHKKRRTRLKRRPSSPRRSFPSLLDGTPDDLSPLKKAFQITEKVSRAGFDWPDPIGLLKKLDEEIQEFRSALFTKKQNHIEEEIGDLFFVLVNLARFLRIDPEDALNKTIEKFVSRFRYIETSLRKKGKTINESSLMEMDLLWEEAKGKRRSDKKRRQ